jgi:hypothetical protein
MSGLFVAGAVVGSILTYSVLRPNLEPQTTSPSGRAHAGSSVTTPPTTPKSSPPVFSPEKQPTPELMNSLQLAADQWAQSQKDSIRHALAAALQQQTEEKLTLWLPINAQRLQLSDEQRLLLEQTLQEKGASVLETNLSSLHLSSTQQQQLQQWHYERRQTRAESAALRTLSQLTENLPLTAPQKDQIWPLLSQEALNAETTALTSEQREAQQQELREKLTHILGAQNAEIVNRALPSLSPQVEMMSE